jgi:cytochrome b subunit of formate dehydrogenase
MQVTRTILHLVLMFLILTIGLAAPLGAQENGDCLECHEDRELTGTRGGKLIFVYVDPAAYAVSVHGDLSCTDCHADLEGAELPHKDDLEIVECATCHEEEASGNSRGPHGKWRRDPASPSMPCKVCHGVHDVPPAAGEDAPTGRRHIQELCGRCHSAQVRQVAQSPHGRVGKDGPASGCADCHKGHDMQAPEEPLRQAKTCGVCHPRQAQEHAQSLHGKAAAKGDRLAPSCVTCHQHHIIRPKTDQSSMTSTVNVPLLCGRCHHEGSEVSLTHDIPKHRILENYSLSIHGEGLFKKGLTVTAVCTSCHTAHNILDSSDPKSSINRNNVAGTCMACHARIEEVHVKVVKDRLWEEAPHKIPSCVECHQPHKIRRAPVAIEGAASKDCLRCHANPDLVMEREGKTVSLSLDQEAFGLAMHHNVQCAQCHTGVTPGHPERACATITSPVDCSICHAEQVARYTSSTHGRLVAKGDKDAPTCLTCHEYHATQGHLLPTARTFPRNVPELCGRCHGEGGAASARTDSGTPHVVARYMASAHGKGLLESGLVVCASCIDCHTSHHPLPKDDPESSVNPRNLADTCGTCHKGIEEAFKKSIHWPGNVRTDKQLPTCEDCHTSHSISRIDMKGFRVMMMNQCGRCHAPESETFFDTYHGKVSRLGSEGAAKCYDCHGTHDILPTTNPNSTLSRRNVVATCAKCHPGAHRRFAGYLSHATHHDPDKYPYLFYSFWFMTSLLVGTLTFAVLHTMAWLWRLWRTREQWLPFKGAVSERFYVRFTRKQRIMHLIMLLSFFTLAVTGMTLKFSYMAWAQLLAQTFGSFDVLGVFHRIAGVTLLSLFVYHVRDMWIAKRASGRSWLGFIFGPNSIMFNTRDLKQGWGSVKWFFGRGPRPDYGRFTYWEKFDYFAVFWGVFVIGSTGLVLWFPEFFTRFLPGWSVNVATIIHSDEALLAVGFIFTIHFFNTHFRPDKFPMDPVIFTGRVPLDELKHDKPAEYREFIEEASAEEREARITGPADGRFERTVRIFGLTALTIGLTLIGLIVYAMLFGYR